MASFNGAAAFQQRKSQDQEQERRELQRFNGAAAFQQRKYGLVTLNLPSKTALQWGRCLSAAEIAGPDGGVTNGV